MDPFAATDKVLRIPELLTSVLRCLGPLSWLKCASVCSVWSHAILAHDGDKGGAGARTACRAGARKTPATKRAVAAATTAAEAAVSVAVSASTENRAAAAAAAPPPGAKAEPSPASERSTAIGGEEGDGRTVVAAAVAADLWREFAVTVIRYRDESTARGTRQKASSSGGGGGGGGGVGARGGSSFYRHVCIEGDPTVLGPPLRAMTAVSGGNSSRPRDAAVATVSLADVIAASEARYRRPRALIKFLSLWSRYQYYGTTSPALTVEVNHEAMLITYSSPSVSRRQKGGGGGGGGARGRDRRGCGASFAKAAPAQPVLSSSSNSSASSSKKKSKPPSPACCAVTTAKLSDALGVFTKLLVLCRRCRRPCTTLYATQGGASGGGGGGASGRNSGGGLGAAHSSGAQYSGGGKGSAPRAVPPSLPVASTGCRGMGVTLWVECQGEGCGLISGVEIVSARSGGRSGGSGGGGVGPPEWLVRFSRYVLNRSWKDINTLPEDHGTEWFSDTSPAAVRRRQDEARASSVGLDALAGRRGGIVGQTSDEDGSSSSSSSSNR